MIKVRIITKENDNFILSISKDALKFHNSGIEFKNPFTGLQSIAFLLKFNDRHKTYFYKE